MRNSAPVQIKICGITNRADAVAAIDCGAHALGFNLYRGSKRFIDVGLAGQWIGQLGDKVRKVAVMVNPTLDEALQTARLTFFDALQLHGNESPEFCRALAEQNVPFTKAVPMCNEGSLSQPTLFSTKNILLDSATPSGFGGTGKIFPWSLAARFVNDHPQFHVILAGGLTAENVANAIAIVRPAGVDVTTGVERAPGRKDPARLQAFVSAVANV